MKTRILNIPEFSDYLKVGPVKSDELHVVNFDEKHNIRLQSDPVTIDFYLLAIKPPIDDQLIRSCGLKVKPHFFRYLNEITGVQMINKIISSFRLLFQLSFHHPKKMLPYIHSNSYIY
ncbi:MAG: hypothetical protein LBE92_21450 [Chryseobacterium sp.]|jgi:uncharacterized protein with NAD-binding domain and iron-sulfur cluster|uniref:hypothetical protein n=1 Tax=Chryseobacterium sp. TaxID=1871047 RepID=UPI00282348B6|nr:hypothetical protein [Chryseobacterium sp.]MDR2238688.1 hypothetical protein [Chryseobacterium sp.]